MRSRKAMAKDGHLIGVHCLTHKDLTKEKISDAAKELCDTREKIRAVTGDWPEYVRPPYGSWNAKLEEAVDMIPVFWDVDSIDWRVEKYGESHRKSGERYGGRGHYPDA